MDGGSEEQRERSRIKAAVRKNFRRVKKKQAEARYGSRADTQTASETQAHAQFVSGAKIPSRSYDNQVIQPHDAVYDSQALTNNSWNMQEANLLMYYFDQVFPWQFPYHHVHLSLGKRGWLFLLFVKGGPLYQASLSLSSLHQSALLGTGQELSQKQRAFDRHSKVLRDMCTIMSEQGDELIQDHTQLAELLACSVMLMSFEVFDFPIFTICDR